MGQLEIPPDGEGLVFRHFELDNYSARAEQVDGIDQQINPREGGPDGVGGTDVDPGRASDAALAEDLLFSEANADPTYALARAEARFVSALSMAPDADPDDQTTWPPSVQAAWSACQGLASQLAGVQAFLDEATTKYTLHPPLDQEGVLGGAVQAAIPTMRRSAEALSVTPLSELDITMLRQVLNWAGSGWNAEVSIDYLTEEQTLALGLEGALEEAAFAALEADASGKSSPAAAEQVSLKRSLSDWAWQFIQDAPVGQEVCTPCLEGQVQAWYRGVGRAIAGLDVCKSHAINVLLGRTTPPSFTTNNSIG